MGNVGRMNGGPEPAEPQMKSIRASEHTFEKGANNISPHIAKMESGSAGSAADILREARAAGITLSLWRGFIDWRAEQGPGESMLARLRNAKAELVEILGGDRCRHCSKRMTWPGPVGVVFGDGTAAHIGCFKEAEGERLMAAAARVLVNVVGTSDEGEFLRAGGEP
jgi:hypothetical protein